jgi:tetratricopeptide (TPR) repeat protein
MGPSEIPNRSSPEMSRPPRPARWSIAVVAATGLACLLGGFWWLSDRSTPARRARAAAAQGRDYLRAGRPDLAFQSVNEIRDDSPEAGEAMAVAGMALARMGQYRVSRMALERAMQLQPDQFEAAVTLAELNLDLGNAARGAERLATAARLRPREFGVWRTLGRALGDANDPTGASHAYQRALELRPGDRDVLIALIDTLIKSGQSDLAEPWILKALENYPADAVVLGYAALGALDSDRIDEAVTFADRAIRRDPQNPEAMLARARCRIARSRWKEALPDMERAAAADPNDPGTLLLLWLVESRLELAERAATTLARRKEAQDRAKKMDQLTEELRLHPDDPKVVWRMGQVATEAGSILYAIRCFEASLALDPDYRPARESLAALRVSHPELARTPTMPASPNAATRAPRTRSGPTR